MRRRDFIIFAGGAAAFRPFSALAQQSSKVWRMGFIAHGHEAFYEALFEGLKQLGYEEGTSSWNVDTHRAAQTDLQNLQPRWSN
jgi:hypothetical protein